jgi:hypothetical protein
MHPFSKDRTLLSHDKNMLPAADRFSKNAGKNPTNHLFFLNNRGIRIFVGT